MNKQVMTVLGLIDPDKLGVIDGHNHIWISPQMVPAVNAPVLDQPDQILAELKEYRQVGGRSQMDCQPIGAGRDGRKLRWLSRESEVHIVASTGFHLQEYYPLDAEIWRMDMDQAANLFIDEIENGLVETRMETPLVFPGFIKIAVRESLQESPLHLIEAAVLVSMQSGYLIEMHTQKGNGVEDFIEFISGLGLPTERLVICHIDKRPDIGLHQELAKAGYLLEYDTFFRPKYEPEKHVWPLIEQMAGMGLDQNLVLATDLADGSLWQKIGKGPGICSFVNVIQKRLEKMALSKKSVMGLCGGNLACRLAIG